MDMTDAFDDPYTFPMPSVLNKGLGATSPVTVPPGMTLYVCATIRDQS